MKLFATRNKRAGGGGDEDVISMLIVFAPSRATIAHVVYTNTGRVH